MTKHSTGGWKIYINDFHIFPKAFCCLPAVTFCNSPGTICCLSQNKKTYFESSVTNNETLASIKKSWSGKTHQKRVRHLSTSPSQTFSCTSRCYHQNKHWFSDFISTPHEKVFTAWVLSPHQSGFWVWWVFRLKQITTVEENKETKAMRVNSLRVINFKFRRIIAIEKFNRKINNINTWIEFLS